MEKLYNLEYLEEISGGDKDFIADMLNDFFQNAPKSLKEIETLILEKNWAQVYAVVHRYIPSFDFVGANEIRTKLRVIESNAKNLTELEKNIEILNEIKNLLPTLIESLKKDLNF